MTIKISSKLIIQLVVAFLLLVISLFLIHFKEDAHFSKDPFFSTVTMSLKCPLGNTNSHTFEIQTKDYQGFLPPFYNITYFKSYFSSGISHWGYLLIGIIAFTLLFQIKFEIEPLNKANDFINNGQSSKTLEFFVIILIMLAGIYFVYTLQAS